MPSNRGLERFNYLALREFIGRPAVFQRVRGEEISQMVEEQGGYGWTGNDLFNDYCLSAKRTSSLQVLKTITWPEEIKPKLCLVGPEEILTKRMDFCDRLEVAVANKYQNLARTYLQRKKWNPRLSFLSGQVDCQIRLGQADLAIDIVYSGKTMQEEKLRIYDTLFDQAALVLITKDI